MFYEPKKGHGLPRDPFKALIAPRPIGWFTTLNDDGTLNLGPYSFFNAVGDAPPVIFFSAGPRSDGRLKDSARNAEKRGEFVHNMVTWDLRDAMNTSSDNVEPGVDETKLANLALADSNILTTPRLADPPVSMECKYMHTVEIPQDTEEGPSRLVFGEVVGIHIDESIMAEGRVALARAKPISRLGYAEYAVVNEESIFRMVRPDV